MIGSGKPRKQRLFRYTAPSHVRQKFVHAHIAKELAKKLGIRMRTAAVRRGDTVKIMAGDNRGKSGKVTSVNMGRSIIFVEGISRKTSKGKEIQMPISASNVYITDMDLNDKFRAAKMQQPGKQQAAK